jgi:hypothetical protein
MWWSRKKKPTMHDYVGKMITFAEYRPGFGMESNNTWTGRCTRTEGDDTLFVEDTFHKSLGNMGHKFFLFSRIRILDTWEGR